MRWLIVAGGTGGHLFPGIAVAEELQRLGKEVCFVSGKRKIEKTILKDRPFKVYEIDVEGFLGRSMLNKFRAGLKMVKGIFQSYRLINHLNPDIIFATGGYISFPVVIAGKIKNKVTALHEQNVEPGLANKILSYMVNRVFISIPGSEKSFPKGKVVFSGNPVRKSILAKRPKEHTGLGLLILGGSLGARFINELALEIMPKLLIHFKDLLVFHQTGIEEYEKVKNTYEKTIPKDWQERVRVFPFIEDMGWAYSQADLFLGRAGATTLAELFAVGLPAVFIPFPYATRDHQKKNALRVAEKGGAVVVDQKEATPDKVLQVLKNLLNDRKKLQEMAEVMKSFFVPSSEKIIIEELERLANV
ncbi:undecaprenyldiphospho-muramoylpentapeptide beta-N-acetylglucosaminyltransferase [Thermodesulfobacterium hveragerdense]|uniref:undecaprenyldiphospho-muramoylpentapeptide beta-N-acetylglucosaminyltransferase n=1 Tax=Thermodesulfobacterium hveragerdense TaxID=53424 RepID=UPI00041339DC|nr:undecaprenyldiphospho-muramoylpentapeptide beta-N-acetylglucosaminyltransferase [Thermodesulfobacterium hveragerdense]